MIIVISGKQGWGKTINATSLAIRELVDHNRSIIASYNINGEAINKAFGRNFPKPRRIDSFEEIKRDIDNVLLSEQVERLGVETYAKTVGIKVEEVNKKLASGSSIKHTTLILDEAMLIADSRRSASKDNIDLSHYAAQFRKLDVNCIIIMQEFGSIDVRLRGMLHERIQCLPVVLGQLTDAPENYHSLFFTISIRETNRNAFNGSVLDGEEWNPVSLPLTFVNEVKSYLAARYSSSTEVLPDWQCFKCGARILARQRTSGTGNIDYFCTNCANWLNVQDFSGKLGGKRLKYKPTENNINKIYTPERIIIRESYTPAAFRIECIYGPEWYQFYHTEELPSRF